MVAYGSALSRTNTEEGSLEKLNTTEQPPPKRMPYSQQQRLPPWTWKNIRWAMGGYITFVHVIGLIGLSYVPLCKTATLWFAFALWPITGFGITGGAHRLWAHRSYTASPLFRCVTMLANSCANQGSIWHLSLIHI